MATDSRSFTARLIIPIFITIVVIAAALILFTHRISKSIVEEYVAYALADHIAKTVRILETAQSDLMTARLLDNPLVVEAKKDVAVEAVILNWQQKGISGAVLDDEGNVIITTLPANVVSGLISVRDAGHIELDGKKGAVRGTMVRFPAWGWRIFIVTRGIPDDLARREVFSLIPLVAGGCILMIVIVSVILRRNLQKPISAMMKDMQEGKALRSVAVSELDLLGQTINDALAEVASRNADLARELQERRQAEEKIIEERNKFESIIAAIGDGISIQDREYTVLYQNGVHKRFFGDQAGRKCYKVYEHRNDVCPDCPVARTFEDGAVHRSERSVETPAGTSYFDFTTSPLRDAGGQIVSCIELVRDVTERRRADEHLQQAQRMESIGQLAGGIAHDFNNILNAILGYADLLRAKMPVSDPQKLYAEQIISAVERGASITRQILMFSRRQAMSRRPVDVNMVIKSIDSMLRRLVREDIVVRLDLLGEPLIASADAAQIDQVMINLASNASDAMPGGGSLIIKTDCLHIDDQFIEYHGFGRPGDYVVISVSDTGQGMDEKIRGQIFDPFFTTKETGKGTGLGMATVYGIVKNHDGYIDVHSELGKGTVFRIYLPLALDASEFPVNPDAADSALNTGGSETVLVAEDDQVLRTLVTTILGNAGYRVIPAADGSEAVRKFYEYRDEISLAILDGVMPLKNGREAYLKMLDRKPDLKAIFVSGYADYLFSFEGVPLGSVTVIQKPVSPVDLLRTVRQVLDRTRESKY